MSDLTRTHIEQMQECAAQWIKDGQRPETASYGVRPTTLYNLCTLALRALKDEPGPQQQQPQVDLAPTSSGALPKENDMDDLPGMLALAEGVAKQRWPHTMDAQVWTQEWLKTVADKPDIATDEGTMIAWFANAIMAGYDTAQHQRATNPSGGHASSTASEANGPEQSARPTL